MDKREFLKTSGAFLAGTMLSSLASAEKTVARTNWSGNYTYSTDHLLQPQNLAEVQQAVKSCHKLRALGACHSFNGIADSTENQISLTHLQEMVLNREARTVTVGAGFTYSQLAPYLDSHGYALPNLASLPHITVAGAIATATHGSGSKNGNLATPVSGLELVTADGQVLVLHDLLGLQQELRTKFCKPYANSYQTCLEALNLYATEVKDNLFPELEKHSFE